MTRLLRLEVLQWSGLLVGPAGLLAGHLLGYGTTAAVCDAGNRDLGVSNDAYQIGIAIGASLVILAAMAAAVLTFRATRGAEVGDGPPEPGNHEPFGRLHFFATAALVSNTIFLGIIVLNALGSLLNVACRQS
jgi:hypothetical protein